MDGGHSQSYQTLTVLHLNKSCEEINVAKYTWPDNEFEQKSSVRGLSYQNLKNMIFKNESKKLKHPKVQEHLNG